MTPRRHSTPASHAANTPCFAPSHPQTKDCRVHNPPINRSVPHADMQTQRATLSTSDAAQNTLTGRIKNIHLSTPRQTDACAGPSLPWFKSRSSKAPTLAGNPVHQIACLTTKAHNESFFGTRLPCVQHDHERRWRPDGLPYGRFTFSKCISAFCAPETCVCIENMASNCHTHPRQIQPPRSQPVQHELGGLLLSKRVEYYLIWFDCADQLG